MLKKIYIHNFRANKILKSRLINLTYELGEAQFSRDDNSAGAIYPFDGNQSAVATRPSRADNTRLTWFRERLNRLIIVQIIPIIMSGYSVIEELLLDYNMTNYVSWYCFIYKIREKPSQLAFWNPKSKEIGRASCRERV